MNGLKVDMEDTLTKTNCFNTKDYGCSQQGKTCPQFKGTPGNCHWFDSDYSSCMDIQAHIYALMRALKEACQSIDYKGEKVLDKTDKEDTLAIATFCSECKTTLMQVKSSYCPHCGIKLNWEETDGNG